jgi:hypothetical protein
MFLMQRFSLVTRNALFVVCYPCDLTITARRESIAGGIATIHNSASVSIQVQVHRKRDSNIFGDYPACWMDSHKNTGLVYWHVAQVFVIALVCGKILTLALYTLGSAENC